MLQFVFGRAACGKTYTVLQKIKQDVIEGKEVIYLIPEQFSFEGERAVLHTLGDKAATNVNVLSFTRIFDEVQRLYGGNAYSVMSDCDKTITMRLALKTVAPELKLWKKYVSSARFTSTIINTLDEFKTCAVSAEQLSDISGDSSLCLKLADFTKIFLTYDALIHNKFIDPVDKLTHLYNQLSVNKYFKGKTVYVDSFKEFSGQQFKILERILSQADDVTVTLLMDDPDSTKTDIFYNVRNVYRKLCQMAKKCAVNTAEAIFLDNSRYSSKEMKALEKSFCENILFEEKPQDISVFKADNVYDEAEYVARSIRRLVRENNFRYEDFVIIARDTAAYETAILNACEKNKVSVFYDARRKLTHLPLSIFVNYAIDAALKISTASIFNYLKTGLSNLSFDEINELENYVALWNIDGALWFDKWDMSPNGFVSEETEKDTTAELMHINKLRETAITPLEFLRFREEKTAREYAKAILDLFKHCNISEKMVNATCEFEREDNLYFAELLRQSYDKFNEILDSCVRCLGEKSISLAEFFETLKLAVETLNIGTIPQMLDQVTFGAADRIRPSRPKVAFVLGMNQGVFPQSFTQNGIFADFERKQLIDMGIEITDNSLIKTISENLLVYTSFCCPSDKLFISYVSGNIAGEVSEPSAILKKIKRNFINLSEKSLKNDVIACDELPETENTAFSYYSSAYSVDKNATAAIRAAANGFDTLQNKIESLDLSLNNTDFSLSNTAADKLFGDSIHISASAFETYHRCPFSYFCRYGLRLKRIQPASLDVLQRGTLVHYILEKYIERYKNKFNTVSIEEIPLIVNEITQEYLNGIRGIKQIISARFEFLLNIIKDAAAAVVMQVTKEFCQSEFVPDYCEFSIGNDGNLPAIEIAVDDNLKMKLIGSIDRVDSWNGYVRIVDYKTGTKTFKLPDILCGLNMQMLIYLYAIVRGKDSEYYSMTPAGILYMPSKKDISGDGMCMNGMLLQDMDLVTAMEKNNAGEFVPRLRMKKDGSFYASSTYTDSDTFETIFDYITKLICDMGDELKQGNIAVSPIDDGERDGCRYCDYGAICRIENKPHKKTEKLSNGEVLDIMKGSV